jgi:hypothetical protein
VFKPVAVEEDCMARTGWQVWFLFATLVAAVPATAGFVSDCEGEADGTLCRDQDDNPCTRAACAADDCIQSTPAPPGSPCCTDGTNPDAPGTACPETDGDICSNPACNAVGDCNQGFSRMEDGTECPDTDGQESTVAACFEGECDQTFSAPAVSPAPTLSTLGGVLLMSALAALGYRRLRRSR